MTVPDLATGVLVPLGDSGWSLWPDAALRATGFPVERLESLLNRELAAAADAWDGVDERAGRGYERVCAQAGERLRDATRALAVDPRFRRAVAWQNPRLVHTCLDRVATRPPRNVRGRNHELAIVSYLQRYCLKNDTIGFFGPVGWARLSDAGIGLEVDVGPGLLARRTTYFEHWAIDAVAESIAARPEVFGWLRPQAAPSVSVSGAVVRPARGPAQRLTPVESDVLRRCDGSRTVREMLGDPADLARLQALLRLRQRGIVVVGLGGPLSTWPERDLAARIAELPDADVRQAALRPLGELVAARDHVAAAAEQDPATLLAALDRLAAVFERVTGRAPTRSDGEVYAGRTLVYEDAIRAVEARLGRRLLDELALPLGLILDSAAWLAATVAERFLALIEEVFRRRAGTAGGDTAMPLLSMLPVFLPELGTGDAMLHSALAEEVGEEFRARWQRVLGASLDAREDPRPLRLAAAGLTARFAEAFGRPDLGWSGSTMHSVDLLLRGADAAALATGDVDVVLGELHCSTNTLQGRLFAEQHPAPGRLRAALDASARPGRVMHVRNLTWPQSTARMSTADQLLPADATYVSHGRESLALPDGAELISIADLELVWQQDGPAVRHRPSGRLLDVLEVVRDPLALLVSDAFRMFPPMPARRRVSLDRLVVGRAAWSFATEELGWASLREEGRRYAAARRWRAEHGLPEMVFVSIPHERKPIAVDFRSLPLVNLVAKVVRTMIRDGGGSISVSEMLPSAGDLWLRDDAGGHYTAELRLVAVR